MRPPKAIDYMELSRQALRRVVHAALEHVEKAGRMPDGHQFFITFMTGAPGVHMPKLLRARHRHSMTIVLNTYFWDLVVAPDHFQVTLSFNERRTRLTIPYEAMTRFFDPTQGFGLDFLPAGANPLDTHFEDLEPDLQGDEPPVEPDEDAPDAQIFSLADFRKEEP